jgi:K+-sensing histidine kinase KdpD
MITHEIRTPLTTIISFAQTLAEEEDLPKEERNHYLSIIEQQGKRITHFLNELTEIMRMETGSAFNLSEFDLNELISSTVSQPDFTTEKPVELTLPTTHCTIRADYTLLQTAIRILLIYLGTKCNSSLSLRLENRTDIAHVTIACKHGVFTEKELHELFDINKQLLLSLAETPVKNRPVYAAAIIRGHKGSIWTSATPEDGALIAIELSK